MSATHSTPLSQSTPPYPAPPEEAIADVIGWFAERQIDVFCAAGTPWPASVGDSVKKIHIEYSHSKSTFLDRKGKIRKGYIPSFYQNVVIKFLDDDEKGLKTPMKHQPNRKKYSSFRLETLDAEVSSMRSGQTHPNVLRLYGALVHVEFSHKLSKWTLQCGLVMEHAGLGDNFDFIDNITKLSWQRMGHVPGVTSLPGPCYESHLSSLLLLHLRQTCSALAYFHDVRKIAHRDLKLENVFVTEDLTAKLADFGHGWGLGREDPYNWGTTIYRDPFVQPKDWASADIYTIGACILVTLAKISFDRLKFEGLLDAASAEEEDGSIVPTMLGALRPIQTTSFMTMMRRLAQACTSSDVSSRPTAAHIVQLLENIETQVPGIVDAKTAVTFFADMIKEGRGHTWDFNKQALRVRVCATIEQTMTYFLGGIRRARQDFDITNSFKIQLVTQDNSVSAESVVVYSETEGKDVVPAALITKLFEHTKATPHTWLRCSSRKDTSDASQEQKVERMLRQLDLSQTRNRPQPKEVEVGPTTQAIVAEMRRHGLEAVVPKGQKDIPYYTVDDLRAGVRRRMPELLLWNEVSRVSP